MDWADYRMSQKQIHEFATAIFSDIDAYVQAHQEEFEKFLREEQASIGDGENETHMQTV